MNLNKSVWVMFYFFEMFSLLFQAAFPVIRNIKYFIQTGMAKFIF